MKQIREATTKDADAVSNLRIREFSRSKDFKLLKPETLCWNSVDEDHTVLAVWDDTDQAIATIRLIKVTNQSETEKMMKSKLSADVVFPAFIFTTAATVKEKRNHGFNQLIRYYGIQIAKAQGIQSLLSPVFQNSPRVNFMKSLGYVCYDRPISWQSPLIPGSQRILCILEQRKFESALDILKENVSELIKSYPWTGADILTP